MANTRLKPEEIVAKLRQVEVLTGQGIPHLPADIFNDPLCRRFVFPGFHSHLHSLMVTMSLKSSSTQSTYSVPWVLMSDRVLDYRQPARDIIMPMELTSIMH